MPPELWLLRHGEAEPHDAKPDERRALTPRGEAQAAAAGAALARLAFEPAACYTSPKFRARDTAALACRALGVEPEEASALRADFALADVHDLLHAHGPDDAVLVVGHEPDFSQVVLDLTGARIDLPKGGIAAVRLERGGGVLLALLRPRELEAIALAGRAAG